MTGRGGDRGPCVCGHGHLLVDAKPPALYERFCWGRFKGCECATYRRPVDPYYRHARGHKPASSTASPGQGDNTTRVDRVHYYPISLPIADAVLADPEYGQYQTITLGEFRRRFAHDHKER